MMLSVSSEPPPPMPRRHRRTRSYVIASTLALVLMLLLSEVASAHALLARSDPAEGAILDQAPSQVRLWFTEDVNPALTQAVVVDKNNHEVDRKNSQVSSSDPREVDVGLNQLSPGVYVVIWRSVSAEDGHATGGSFYFRVRFPDGSVPALPSDLPTGPAGFSNTSSGQCLTGSAPLLCAPEVLSEWLVFLATVIFVGGIFWQAFMVELAAQRDRALVSTALATARRFRPVAATALVVFLIANLGYVMGQTMLAGGSFASGFSPTLWSGALLHSSFGVFWLLRGIIALVALLLLVLFPERPATEEEWRPNPALNYGRMVLGLCLLVTLAFSGHAAAAQAKGKIGPFAIPVDWLHLLSVSLWVGGLLFIALVLMPAIWGDEPVKRGQALVKLLPRFSVIALCSVFTAAVTGSLNADVQLSSWDQFLNTTYGRTLIIKILLFIVMMGISAYHAYRIRPALARELGAWDRLQAETGADNGTEGDNQDQKRSLSTARQLQQKMGSLARPQKARAASQAQLATPTKTADLETAESQMNGRVNESLDSDSETAAIEYNGRPGVPGKAQTNGHGPEKPSTSSRALAQIEQLSEKIRAWIQREAALGVGVLLCAALLGGLAGSLAPTLPGAPNVNVPTMTATTKTPVDLMQTVDNLQVTLKVAPDKFGTNSFGALVKDATTGKPIDGANVHLIITMVEMDMGTGTADLKGVGGGFYTGQGDLLMGGHWQVIVQVRTPQDPTTIHRFTFTFSVAFS